VGSQIRPESDGGKNILIYFHVHVTVHRDIFLMIKPSRCTNWGDHDVDGRIILRWIFRKLEGVVGTGWNWLRIGTGGGHLWVR
jgi:hypothetical protein